MWHALAQASQVNQLVVSWIAVEMRGGGMTRGLKLTAVTIPPGPRSFMLPCAPIRLKPSVPLITEPSFVGQGAAVLMRHYINVDLTYYRRVDSLFGRLTKEPPEWIPPQPVTCIRS